MRLAPSLLPLAALALLATRTWGAEGLPLTDEGKRLAQALDALDVQNHWKSGEHISRWKTGAADGKRGGPKTHCSLFVAAVCARLAVPMLAPPPQTFLSNRQQEWLLAEGKDRGWGPVSAVTAQRLANRGTLVLASYKNPQPRKAGHIAVVHPAGVTVEEVRERGPHIAQAGTENYADTDVRTGFRHHRGAWERHEIHYFAYRPAGK